MFSKIRSAIAAICIAIMSTTAANALYMNQNIDRHVTFVNQSSHGEIIELNASGVKSGTWEEDILGDSTVVSEGYQTRINIDDGSGNCYFDFRAVFEDGTVLVRRNDNICGGRIITFY